MPRYSLLSRVHVHVHGERGAGEAEEVVQSKIGLEPDALNAYLSSIGGKETKAGMFLVLGGG